MAKFISELTTHLLDDDTIWELDELLVYKSDYFKDDIIVPVGFQTDFASVPRVPIIYGLWGDRAHREGVLHDYLYRIDSLPQATRSLADDIFYEAMNSREKPWYVRYPMKWGVRVGGWTAYHKRYVGEKLCTV
jgi:hypothetical protein